MLGSQNYSMRKSPGAPVEAGQHDAAVRLAFIEKHTQYGNTERSFGI
jgi:hypothetical protein